VIDMSYDERADTITIYGQRYSGDLFRSFGFVKPGTWLRIEARHGDTFTVFQPDEVIERAFDAIAGRSVASMPK
jgi:hypothetical protein